MTEAEKALLERDEDTQASYLGGQTVSLIFLRRNRMFKSSKANAAKMGDFIKAENLAWTVENLEHVLAEHAEDFEMSCEPIQPAPVVVEEKPLPLWGILKTRADINAIPRDDYRKFMKSAQFQKTVNKILQGGE